MREVAIRNTDSILRIVRRVDGAVADTDDVTRCDLVLRRPGVADYTISSVGEAAWFNLETPFMFGGRQHTCIGVNLRLIPNPPPDGSYEVDVFIWDADAPNGSFWGVADLEIRPANP